MTERGDKIPDRLLDLLSELTDGEPSEALREELRRLLAADPIAAEWYCQWMSLHSLLYIDLTLGEVGTSAPRTPTGPLVAAASAKAATAPRKPWRLVAAAAFLSATAAALAVMAYYQRIDDDRGLNIAEATREADRVQATAKTADSLINDSAARLEFNRVDSRPIAVLSRVADAAWSSSTPLAEGAGVAPGRFVLDSGVVQLEFMSGANVVVEGPADLDLVSSKQVFCRRGKLRAHVPHQAQGFIVETPTQRAVDLGTEFAIDVDDKELTEVHVINGEVRLENRLADANQEHRLLTLGDGFRDLADGTGAPIKAQPERFLGAEQLLRLSQRNLEERYSLWRQYSQRLSSDPDAVAYYNFDAHSPWSRTLRNDGPLKFEGLTGAIVGARWSEGRWPGKQALEFKGIGDRVRVHIPGEYVSISLACWVRIDGFDRFLSSLLLTEGQDEGEVHWQFTDAGQLLLGVKADSEWSQDYYSRVVLHPTDVGRWIHLACVYDQHAGKVSHFLDGRRVSIEATRKHSVLRFGAADIGNWLPDDYHTLYRIRSLNGRMDELVVFKRAITEEEVWEMYEAGKPSS